MSDLSKSAIFFFNLNLKRLSTLCLASDSIKYSWLGKKYYKNQNTQKMDFSIALKCLSSDFYVPTSQELWSCYIAVIGLFVCRPFIGLRRINCLGTYWRVKHFRITQGLPIKCDIFNDNELINHKHWHFPMYVRRYTTRIVLARCMTHHNQAILKQVLSL